MPETPIVTDTATHPFDTVELNIIRGLCQQAIDAPAAGLKPELLLNVDYAAHVMPAMAAKIEQLRSLYEQHRDALTTLRQTMAEHGRTLEVTAVTSTDVLAGAQRVARHG